MITTDIGSSAGTVAGVCDFDSVFPIGHDTLKLVRNRLNSLESAGFNDNAEEYMGCSGCKDGERRCGIIITKKCQLRCTYCYEKGKKAETIEVKTAKRILREELIDRADVHRVHVDLFGGEPFLAFDVMRELVSYLEKNTFGKDFYITTITNGMAVHGDIQEWLIEHKGVIECPLSLDGTREMQERNRPGSFDRIDLDFFAREFPGTRAKMTVSNSTLAQLAEGTIFLHELGFAPKNGIAYGTRWDESSDVILIRELGKLIDYYLEHPEIEESLMLSMPYRDICIRNRSCDAGRSMVMYDVDGSKWPCHMFLPMAIGEEKARGVSSLDFSKLQKDDGAYDQVCRSCAINRSCVVCRGTNYNEFGTIFGRNRDVCKFTKIIYRAKANLAAEKWKHGLYSHLLPGDEALLLRAIQLCSELWQ